MNFKHKIEYHERSGWHCTNRIAGQLMFLLAFFYPQPLPSLAETPKILPAKVFFANPKESAYAISPNGKKLAYIKRWKSHLNLFVRAVSKERERPITTEQID